MAKYSDNINLKITALENATNENDIRESFKNLATLSQIIPTFRRANSLPSQKSLYEHCSNIRIIDELTLNHHQNRIDIAIILKSENINDSSLFYGFEIKSDCDSIARLSTQIKNYEAIFDFLYVIIAPKHLYPVLNILPDYYGILLAPKLSGITAINLYRKPEANPNQTPYGLTQLLWKEEALNILYRYDLIHGMKSKKKKLLQEKLASDLPLPVLKYEIAHVLNKRHYHWR